jgi:hypothetical protein
MKIQILFFILLCLALYIFINLYNSTQYFTGVRNQSYDIRGDPFPIAKIPVSPWMMSTTPNYPVPLTYTNSYDGWSNGGYIYNEFIPPLQYYNDKKYKPFSLFANNV